MTNSGIKRWDVFFDGEKHTIVSTDSTKAAAKAPKGNKECLFITVRDGGPIYGEIGTLIYSIAKGKGLGPEIAQRHLKFWLSKKGYPTDWIELSGLPQGTFYSLAFSYISIRCISSFLNLTDRRNTKYVLDFIITVFDLKDEFQIIDLFYASTIL